MSSIVATLVERLGMPPSTAKWSLRSLRELGLIRCGNSEEKGVPTRLTPVGRLIARAILRGVG